MREGKSSSSSLTQVAESARSKLASIKAGYQLGFGLPAASSWLKSALSWSHGNTNLCHGYGFVEGHKSCNCTCTHGYPWPIPVQVSIPLPFTRYPHLLGLALTYLVNWWSLYVPLFCNSSMHHDHRLSILESFMYCKFLWGLSTSRFWTIFGWCPFLQCTSCWFCYYRDNHVLVS